MEIEKFNEVKTANDESIFIDGEVAVDTMVYQAASQTILIDGKPSTMQYPIWSSIIELADGNILKIADGKIVEITQKEGEATPVAEDKPEEKLEKRTLLQKVKAMFAKEEKPKDVEADQPEETKKESKDYKTKDNTILRIDGDIKEGSQVSVVSEDGLSPAPKGDHEIPEIKKTISIDDKGLITGVVDTEENKEEELADEEATPSALDIPADERLTKLETRIAEMEEAIMILSNQINETEDIDVSEEDSDELSKVKAELERVKIENENLSKEPAAPSIKTKKVDTEIKLENENVSAQTKLISEIKAMRLAATKKN